MKILECVSFLAKKKTYFLSSLGESFPPLEGVGATGTFAGVTGPGTFSAVRGPFEVVFFPVVPPSESFEIYPQSC